MKIILKVYLSMTQAELLGKTALQGRERRHGNREC